MARALVLGGLGGIGSVAVRALAAVDEFDQVVIADVLGEEAETAAAQFGDSAHHRDRCGCAVAHQSDHGDEGRRRGAQLHRTLHRFGPPVLRAAIDAGVDYVDVCDDLAPTQSMLAMHDAAQAAGVTALIGMGNSPGIANVIVRLCAEQLLDRVESVDIMHVHGASRGGPRVIKHRLHAMDNPVPLFVNGEFVEVHQLEADGRAFVREFDFRGCRPAAPSTPTRTRRPSPLPHLPGLQRATNMGVIFLLAYFHRTQQLVRGWACPAGAADRG